MPMNPKPAVRLHVLLAREAPTALVIRRGPADLVALFGWARLGDRFTKGDQLRGRVYTLRCDLSADGRHLIYFALNGKNFNGKKYSDTKGSWTAISLAPSLQPLALYANGSTYGGGGLFLAPNEFWLNDCKGWPHEPRAELTALSRRLSPPWQDTQTEEECQSIYPFRLQREGWTWVRTESTGVERVLHFQKAVSQHWLLRKAFRPDGRVDGRLEGKRHESHELFNARTKQTVPCPDWEWADLDGDRLVWAARGMLLTGRPDVDGRFGEQVLHDFNSSGARLRPGRS